MKHDIAFLHTADIHVKTFGELMGELTPDLEVCHVVDKALLVESRTAGGIGPGLEEQIGQAMRSAASTGASSGLDGHCSRTLPLPVSLGRRQPAPFR